MNSLSNIRVGGAAAGAVSEQMGGSRWPFKILPNLTKSKTDQRGTDYLSTGFKSNR